VRTFVVLPNAHDDPWPEEFAGEPDVRFAPSLVRYLLAEFTRDGDAVLDPFAGLGTTLRVAEEMGRAAWGVEFDAARCDYVRARLRHPERLLHGDSRRLDALPLPATAFDFSLASPPYMGVGDAEDPLTNYTAHGRGYAAYLEDLRAVYAQVAARVKPDGRVVIEASNLKRAEGVTTLAWDIARAVSDVLAFDGEIVVGWEGGYGFGYDHSYCLVFRRPEPL